MKEKKISSLMNHFIKISYKLTELEKIPIDFGAGEVLYPSEIHTIDAIGDKVDTVTAISNKFGITKGAVSQVILKLNKKGYIKKVRNEVYSKEIILSLTDKGLKAYKTHKKWHKTMDSEMSELISSYSDEWVCIFQDLLVQFEKQIDRYMLLSDDIKFLE